MSQQFQSTSNFTTEKTRFGLWQAKETLLPIMADYSPLLEAELGNSSSAVTPTTNNDGIPDPPESGLSDAEAQRLLEIYGKSSFYPSVLLSNHQQKQLHRHHHVRRCLYPLLALHSLARFPHHSSNPPCFFFFNPVVLLFSSTPLVPPNNRLQRIGLQRANTHHGFS